MAYVRVPVPTPKSKKGMNTFRLVVVSFMLAVMLIVCIALATSSGATVTDFTTVDAMKSGEVYYIQDLSVIDGYGEVETTYNDDSSAVTQRCYFVTFNDQNGQVCFASLGVTAGSAIYEQCDNYYQGLMNETQQVGSLVLPGCYSVATLESQMDQMETEYKTSAMQIKLALGISGTDTQYHLTYEGATKEEYLEKNSNNTIIGVCITGAFSVLFAVLLFFIIRQRKNIKAQEAAAQQAALEWARQQAAQAAAQQAAAQQWAQQPPQPVQPQGYPYDPNYPQNPQ